MITAIEARRMVSRAVDMLRQIEVICAEIDQSVQQAAKQGKMCFVCDLRSEQSPAWRNMLVEEITRHGFAVTLEGKSLSVSWASETEGGPRA